MTLYLRPEEGVAVERYETDDDIAALFPPELGWVPAGFADLGWLYIAGAWAPPPQVEIDLPAAKGRLKSIVDAEAERERLRYITPGAGQAMTYQAKVEEARRLAEDAVPDPADYPLLAAEVGITDEDLGSVGAVVISNYQAWLTIGAAIEAARLGAKRAIDEAETFDAAEAATQVAWPG